MTETWDITKVAEMLGITRDAAYHRRTYRPDLMPPAIKVGRRVMYNPDTVRNWMLAQEEERKNDELD